MCDLDDEPMAIIPGHNRMENDTIRKEVNDNGLASSVSGFIVSQCIEIHAFKNAVAS